MTNLHLDIETFSSVDIKKAGAYKYLESPDFEILLVAYAFDNGFVKLIDLASGENIPFELVEALTDNSVIKNAHNAVFERQAFKKIGIEIPINQIYCTSIKSGYCGLPLSLGDVSKALDLGDKSKLDEGKALIKYFTMPCKPTKANGGRLRNLPEHDPEKWEVFGRYCMQDVEAEREITKKLSAYHIPEFERELYFLDQRINDRGIKTDKVFFKNAQKINLRYSTTIKNRIKEITNIDNPNSPVQLKKWISEAMKKEIKSLAKDKLSDLIQEATGEVREVLTLRKKSSKTSIKKYAAMEASRCQDGRSHGLFQFYGANRTGRWAGRLVQLQNLPQNHLENLDLARELVRSNDYKGLSLLYDDLSDVLSQLVRVAFVADENKTFAVADFSAIEARVIAWLARERWRLDVFNSHGRIYEASASRMFNVPIEEITKGSDLRQKGKVAELALGYQGGVGALKQMGGERMGLDEKEMQGIVDRWREANPAIVKLWKNLDMCAKEAVKNKGRRVKCKFGGLEFFSNDEALSIRLPSGRRLFYRNPGLRKKIIRKPGGDSWTTESVVYWGMDQTKKIWSRQDTYGGKLAENITQAIARDLLAVALVNLDKEGFKIVMHVHDEAVAEIIDFLPKGQLKKMCDIMARPVDWADGLPLAADGYLTKYYKKD